MEEGDVTRALRSLREGDSSAVDALIPLLYDELRGVARQWLARERSGHTLGATALVSEAYLRLARQNRIEARDRQQFFAVAANTMRRVLVDYARTRNRDKRGGGVVAIPLDEAHAFLDAEEAEEVIALDGALERLAALDPRAARVVEQRFYAGLTVDEIAEVLGVSPRTVHRDWITARAWLRKEVGHALEE